MRHVVTQQAAAGVWAGVTVEGLERAVSDDGRIHTTFNQIVAATGRPLVGNGTNGAPGTGQNGGPGGILWGPGGDGGSGAPGQPGARFRSDPGQRVHGAAA